LILCWENQYAGFLNTGYPISKDDDASSSEDSDEDRKIDEIIKGVIPRNKNQIKL
jgi:hypothetical protein